MLDLSVLEDALNYDPLTGEFMWKIRPSPRVAKGSKAGCIGPSGYVRIRYKRCTFEGQRVAWYLTYKETPVMVDHEDGNPSNNALYNLRAVTRFENSYNSKISTNNTSGVKGVTWDKSRCMWLARVSSDGKRHKVGHFAELEAARVAIEKFRAEKHGEYANHGF